MYFLPSETHVSQSSASITDNISHVRGLETAPHTTKCLKELLCPVVLANLGNQTVVSLFAIYTLNYNIFKLRESQQTAGVGLSEVQDA